uniref:Coiled-coil domain containing 127a n=1 Tax=Cynoglossus semilaevis TaxID=244447 RepID=A0A3P8VTZ0_CYNSE
MNNLNDPPRWNIPPGAGGRGAGAGDGNQWNYALLVPMLGLAAFRWIWTRESQREIQNAKAQYDKDVSLIKSEMEARYRATLTESHRKAATLELELEKEKQKVKGYRQALISQSQHQMEQQKQLQQTLEEQKQRLVVKDPVMAELDVESDLKDIFKRDKHCADLLNMDKRKNGSLMWVYLKYWQLQVTVQKHRKAEEALLAVQTKS